MLLAERVSPILNVLSLQDQSYVLSQDNTNTPVCTPLNYTWPIVPRAAFEDATYLGQKEVFGFLCDVFYLGRFDHVILNTTCMCRT